ncbi:ATP-binding protein [Pseudoxanthobacter sp.]|uniref:ATP-binding protein n=1 Tax=Pseudoxanthobacter sp. TaxID=1925742 RepID=UPI002FE00ABB
MADAIELTITADIAALPDVRDAVSAFAEGHDLPVATAYALELVVDEFMTNSVEHGYRDRPAGPVHLSLRLDGNTIAGEITDEGRAFDPTTAPEPDTTAALEDRAIGGLGVHLARSLLDSLSYQRRGRQNVVLFRLSAAGPPARQAL